MVKAISGLRIYYGYGRTWFCIFCGFQCYIFVWTD